MGPCPILRLGSSKKESHSRNGNPSLGFAKRPAHPGGVQVSQFEMFPDFITLFGNESYRIGYPKIPFWEVP